MLLCGSADSSPSMLMATLFTEARDKQPACLGASDWWMELYRHEGVFLSLKIKFVKGMILCNWQSHTKYLKCMLHKLM